MIVSHLHKYIFIKTVKTAGTSVELALSKFCGPEDIITPVSAEDEELRKETGGRGPQNFKLPLKAVRPRDLAKAIYKRRAPIFYNHMPAVEVKRGLAPEVWSQYTKWAIVRNPFEVVISMYYWRGQKDGKSLSDFITRQELETIRAKTYGMYTINDKVVTDRLIRYENLKDELEALRQDLGIPEPLVLPRAKGNVRADRRHYSQVLSADEVKLIEEVFEPEFRLHGYRFEQRN